MKVAGKKKFISRTGNERFTSWTEPESDKRLLLLSYVEKISRRFLARRVNNRGIKLFKNVSMRELFTLKCFLLQFNNIRN